MGLAQHAVRHGRGIVFLAVAAAVAGLVTGSRMPNGVYPEVSYPREQVVASVPGASVVAVVAGVTRPMEAALASVPGVVRVTSRSIRGAVEFSLFFSPDTDMAQAHPLVLARLADARPDLPADVQIQAERIAPSSFPILSLNVEGPYPATVLGDIARYTVMPALSGLPSVGMVSVQTSDNPEVEVLLDPARLASAHLTVAQIAERIRAANQTVTVARLSDRHELALGVVSADLLSAADVANTVVGGTPQAPILLKQLGRAVEGMAPRTSIIRVDGKPGAIVNVTRRIGGDTLQLDSAVTQALNELRPTLPTGVTLVPIYEQAVFVREGVATVRDAVLLGALLAIFVLALFLRDARATFIAALSLPLTLAASLLVLSALGQTLNLMTLGGIAVAVGLVIDDAVVVIEAVHRHLERGLSSREAAERGTDELFWPVVGTTATTVVVFLPLGLLQGVAGQFFTALAIALSAAVTLSLPISLLVLPAIAAGVLKPVTNASAGERLSDWYAHVLDRALNRRWIVITCACLTIALGAFAGTRLASEFLPTADEGGYVVDYFAPVGASLEETDRLASQVEEILRETPEVAGFSRRLGAELGPPAATLPSRGDIAVRLRANRHRGIEEIMDEQRDKLAAAVPGLRVEFVQVLADMLGDLEGSPDPIEVKIFGPDPAVLQRLVADAYSRVKDVPGLVDVFDGNEGCAPQFDVRVDSLTGGRQGLDARAVGDQLSGQYLGQVATQLRRPDRLVDVRVRLDPKQSPSTPTTLGRSLLMTSAGRVPLGSVSQVHRACPPAVLQRENQRFMAHITARLSGTDLGSAAAAVQQKLSGWQLPTGYAWHLGGLVNQQRSSFQSLLLALSVALGAVLGILLFQLRSWRLSLAVMAAAPLAIAGGLLTLWGFGAALNVSSLMGAILLVGLVVKNGILLLDHAIAAEETGAAPRDALLAAARARLRPIAMTTLATLVALLPLALGLGSGSDLHRPLALTVVGGLAFSTLATLFLVPALALGRRH